MEEKVTLSKEEQRRLAIISKVERGEMGGGEGVVSFLIPENV
jgi:hypothetical protein